MIELYNSSAIESLSKNGKLVSSEGLIDFCALDEYYQANQPALVHLGGKSALMMSAFCQLNSFNMENLNKVKQSMKGQDKELARILDHTFSSNENKFLVLSKRDDSSGVGTDTFTTTPRSRCRLLHNRRLCGRGDEGMRTSNDRRTH